MKRGCRGGGCGVCVCVCVCVYVCVREGRDANPYKKNQTVITEEGVRFRRAATGRQQRPAQINTSGFSVIMCHTQLTGFRFSSQQILHQLISLFLFYNRRCADE